MTYWNEIVHSLLLPLKHCCHVNPAVLPETTDPDWDFDYIDIGSVTLSEGVTHKERLRFEASPSRARKPVQEGDILVSTVRTYLKAIALIEPADAPQVASTGFAVLRAGKNTDARFLHRAVQSNPFVEKVVSQSTGVSYPAIKPSTLSSIEIPLPDLPTQRAIADFLDRETARIDSLIEKKQRLVELLGKKWEATVTFTLTNGLNADVLTKDSGVPWIGGVPDHWEVAKLGHIGRSANGINIGGNAFGSGSPFVSYGDVYRNPELPRSVEGLVQSTAEDRSRYTLKAGDVLFTRTSETIDEIGFSGVCMEDMQDAVFAGFLIRFRPMKSKLIPLFSKFLFRNERLRAFFSKEMMIVTRASLSQGLLQRMPVVIPPLNEQQEISEYLQKVEDTFVSVSEKTETSIDRLKEYRSALITSAVTGQIDVSTYARSGTTDRQLDTIQSEVQA